MHPPEHQKPLQRESQQRQLLPSLQLRLQLVELGQRRTVELLQRQCARGEA